MMNCKAVRRELDEVLPHDNLSVEASEHIRSCGSCRELYGKQTRLQRIVGSLEPVKVPSDFDYRLRARLAESQTVRQPRGWWLQAIAIAAVVAIAATLMVGLHFQRQQETKVAVQQDQPAPLPTNEIRQTQATVVGQNRTEAQSITTPASVGGENIVRHKTRDFAPREVSYSGSAKRIQSIDFSNEGAQRINPVDEIPAFPIDAPAQGLRLSFDDGRGNARTISFPTVSFGSQRVLTSTNQLAPKGVW